MIRRTLIGAVVATALIATAQPTTAASSTHPPRTEVVITFDLAFQPDGTAAGHFAAAGAVSDAGPAEATPRVEPLHRTVGRLTGDLVLHGHAGQMTWSFSGITYPLGAPRAIGRGSARLESGTGEYSRGEGHGHFLTVADFVSGDVSGSIQASFER